MWMHCGHSASAAAQRWLLSQSNDHLHYLLLQLPPVLQITRIIYKVVVECGWGEVEREGEEGKRVS